MVTNTFVADKLSVTFALHSNNANGTKKNYYIPHIVAFLCLLGRIPCRSCVCNASSCIETIAHSDKFSFYHKYCNQKENSRYTSYRYFSRPGPYPATHDQCRSQPDYIPADHYIVLSSLFYRPEYLDRQS